MLSMTILGHPGGSLGSFGGYAGRRDYQRKAVTFGSRGKPDLSARRIGGPPG
jgi:hypothetical protein